MLPPDQAAALKRLGIAPTRQRGLGGLGASPVPASTTSSILSTAYSMTGGTSGTTARLGGAAIVGFLVFGFPGALAAVLADSIFVEPLGQAPSS
jgi:hypothetical protein